MAVLNTSSLSFGTHTITARYEGSNNFNPSGAGISQSVSLIGTNLTLTATPNPVNTGQVVVLTATATSVLGGMIPVGPVTFYEGVTILGTINLGSDGSASFSTSSLSIGRHSLHAVLGDTTYFAGSSSLSLDEVVQSYDFSLDLSKNSVSMPSGDYSNISVGITPIGGFKGNVNLSCEGIPDYALCAFPDGSSVSLAKGAKQITLSMNASNVYGFGDSVGQSIGPSRRRRVRDISIAFLAPALSLLGLVKKRRRYTDLLRLLGTTIAFAVGAFLINGCSGKQPGKTAPGTYVVIVMGTSSDGTNLKHAVPLRFTVIP